MKKVIACLLFLISSTTLVSASESNYPLDKVNIDLNNKDSLYRGAKIFVHRCLTCHSAQYMRYNRVAKDLGLDEEDVKKHLMFTTDKIGDPMTITMRPEDSKKWFGVTPPDLTLVTRYKGAEWLHTYLRTFYLDPKRPNGVNNLVFKDTAMPNPLWSLQGWQTLIEKGDKKGTPELKVSEPGSMTPKEFEVALDDLVNFLAYAGEPAQLERQKYGPKVLFFLAIFCVVTYLLKKEYWKDVH
ncbi:cytochrome c1 [Candidatus Nitrosacidococcus sp. I8]|uniref:cytochrome c1 n=1 Tax=Candidatus Nitrosacidococcus sp. I8 TaxID=2942908 RepID=UPI002227435F|nr:cytochrome c1 [Candidatus Nitrosacidococcus sp. I8]CAH9014604.1 Ammonia monooxygenase gamma subunit [Candidatus Nitrosacidococcus sp. I8]